MKKLTFNLFFTVCVFFNYSIPKAESSCKNSFSPPTSDCVRGFSAEGDHTDFCNIGNNELFGHENTNSDKYWNKDKIKCFKTKLSTPGVGSSPSYIAARHTLYPTTAGKNHPNGRLISGGENSINDLFISDMDITLKNSKEVSDIKSVQVFDGSRCALVICPEDEDGDQSIYDPQTRLTIETVCQGQGFLHGRLQNKNQCIIRFGNFKTMIGRTAHVTYENLSVRTLGKWDYLGHFTPTEGRLISFTRPRSINISMPNGGNALNEHNAHNSQCFRWINSDTHPGPSSIWGLLADGNYMYFSLGASGRSFYPTLTSWGTDYSRQISCITKLRNNSSNLSSGENIYTLVARNQLDVVDLDKFDNNSLRYAIGPNNIYDDLFITNGAFVDFNTSSANIIKPSVKRILTQNDSSRTVQEKYLQNYRPIGMESSSMFLFDGNKNAVMFCPKIISTNKIENSTLIIPLPLSSADGHSMRSLLKSNYEEINCDNNLSTTFDFNIGRKLSCSNNFSLCYIFVPENLKVQLNKIPTSTLSSSGVNTGFFNRLTIIKDKIKNAQILEHKPYAQPIYINAADFKVKVYRK